MIHDEKLERVGKVCSEFRKLNNATQKEYAKELGVSVQTVKHFENGRVRNVNYLLFYLTKGVDIEDVLAAYSD